MNSCSQAISHSFQLVSALKELVIVCMLKSCQTSVIVSVREPFTALANYIEKSSIPSCMFWTVLKLVLISHKTQIFWNKRGAEMVYEWDQIGVQAKACKPFQFFTSHLISVESHDKNCYWTTVYFTESITVFFLLLLILDEYIWSKKCLNFEVEVNHL